MSGLYIHIPFCSVKCRFCDFTAFSGQKRSVARYLCALEREASLSPHPVALSPGSTLYIGGGTPSELAADELSRLLAWIDRTWGGGPAFAESTFEANPESLTDEKLGILGDWGLTRVSLGLQAAQDRLLQGLGRQHDLPGFLKVYDQARRRVREANIDLMFALPGQTAADWRETLDLVVALAPDHVSLYGLRVEERTVFSKLGIVSDEDLGAGMYEEAVDRMIAAGYRHYEISNFARPGRESRHNLGYWSDAPYLGLGCGATSYLGGERRTNEARIEDYCRAVEAGRAPMASSERLTGKARLGEAILLGLRKVGGLDLTPEMIRDFRGSFERLRAAGLLELTPDPAPRAPGARARLSRRGLLLANQAFLEFVEPFV